MPVLLVSGNPLGLRAVGSGGRTAVAAYDQIARTLRQRLGPRYALLFAEPTNRGALIDWYADVERGTPVRLLDAPPAERQAGLAVLEQLVGDVDALAASLRKSDRQDERILGDMLAHALDIPDEGAVYLIDGQPVMTSWGYIRDQGRAAVSPLRSLLRQRIPPSASVVKPTQEPSAATVAAATSIVHPAAAVAPPPAQRGNAIGIVLWSLFGLLLATCAVQLLRGCAIGFPISLTGRVLNFCAADDASRGDLASEVAKQAELQSQYDEMVRRAALKRQACVLEMPKEAVPPQPVDTKPPEPPGPATGPTVPEKVTDGPGGSVDRPDPKDQMTLPPDATKQFLEGCWRAHEGLFEYRDGKSTGNKIKVTFCFNKDGTGSQTVRYVSDNAKCVGPVGSSWDGTTLKIEMRPAVCEGSHGTFSAATATCHRGEEGVAKCDEIADNGTKNFKDFPFTRTNEEP